MIDHVWSVLCAKTLIDKDTNVISIIDVIEQFKLVAAGIEEISPEGTRHRDPSEVDSAPVFPVSVEVVSMWVRRDSGQPASGVTRLRWEARGKEPRPLGGTMDVDLAGDFERMRTRVRINGLPASESGRYYFVVEFQQSGAADWVDVAKLPLDITIEIEGNESSEDRGATQS